MGQLFLLCWPLTQAISRGVVRLSVRMRLSREQRVPVRMLMMMMLEPCHAMGGWVHGWLMSKSASQLLKRSGQQTAFPRLIYFLVAHSREWFLVVRE